jgi:hypothetical protein
MHPILAATKSGAVGAAESRPVGIGTLSHLLWSGLTALCDWRNNFPGAVAPGWYESAPAARHSNLIRNIVSGDASLFPIVMQITTGPDRFDRRPRHDSKKY